MFLMHQSSHILSSAITDMPLRIYDYGIISYSEALAIMKSTVENRIKNIIPDTLLLLEHPPTYTLGINGKMEHLLISQAELKSRNINIHRVDRGGDITFHGPGQLVGYPVLDFKTSKLDIRQYVKKLENIVIQSIADFGISADHNDAFPGAWVDRRKIAAIGVKINASGISSHGFAINVNTDLAFFQSIIPCGLSDTKVTSLAEITGHPIDMERMKESVATSILSESNR
jgi:lipoyl(octanoyl) transferase